MFFPTLNLPVLGSPPVLPDGHSHPTEWDLQKPSYGRGRVSPLYLELDFSVLTIEMEVSSGATTIIALKYPGLHLAVGLALYTFFLLSANTPFARSRRLSEP